MRRLELIRQSWPIIGDFRIARGAKTHAHTLTAHLHENGKTGRGECVPYGRYGESIESVTTQIKSVRESIERGLSREMLQNALPAGAARNALDCALWDLEAKLTGVPVWQRAGVPGPKPVNTALTISIAAPKIMAKKAKPSKNFTLLKLKLAGDGQDLERLAAIHAVRGDARLILDANEGLTITRLKNLLPKLARFNVVLIEQPLPTNEDQALAGLVSPISLCADESLHTSADLQRLAGLYDAVNIKLDKTGGLTGAITLVKEARALNLKIMLGCMVGTSLGMAPSLVLGGMADFIDLDGPLLLQTDRQPGLRYEGALVHPPDATLWG